MCAIVHRTWLNDSLDPVSHSVRARAVTLAIAAAGEGRIDAAGCVEALEASVAVLSATPGDGVAPAQALIVAHDQLSPDEVVTAMQELPQVEAVVQNRVVTITQGTHAWHDGRHLGVLLHRICCCTILASACTSGCTAGSSNCQTDV
jgi:hypothetical protein